MTNDSKPEVVERWVVAHARANRGHRTRESIDNPGECETCGAKSPVWDLVEVGVTPVDDLAAAERKTVDCDESCGAYEQPETLDEYKAAYEHWRTHENLFGCAHGQ